MLAPAIITCKRHGCGQTFRPKRLAQLYCSTPCRKADFKRRDRVQRSVPEASPATTLPEKRPPRLQTPPSVSPGAPEKEIPFVRLWDGPPLQGDDYHLDYYEDGYPKLPACLDRRTSVNQHLTKQNSATMSCCRL
jgi:hypothetical protein